MKKLTPNLMVEDVKETAKFYEKNLGFKLVMAVPESQDGILTEIPEDKSLVFATLKNGNVEMMLQSRENLEKDIKVFEGSKIGASLSLYIEVEDVGILYDSLNGKVEVVKEPSTTWYGTKEFYIRDNNGYVLGFAERSERK